MLFSKFLKFICSSIMDWMLLSQLPSHCSYTLLKSYFPLGNKNEIRRHLELGLEMIKQDALAQRLCCIFTRKCFLRPDTQVLAGLCARRPHLPCMRGACAWPSQSVQRVGRYWPFHILLWRVSPWARVLVISFQISYLLKSPLLNFGKEKKWIECDFVLLSSENTGALEFIISYWNTGQPGVEVVGGARLRFGRMRGFTCLRLLLPMSPWAMSEA